LATAASRLSKRCTVKTSGGSEDTIGPAPTTPISVGSAPERNSSPNTTRNINGKTKVNSSAVRSRTKPRSRALARMASWPQGDGGGRRTVVGRLPGGSGGAGVVAVVALMLGTPVR